jgi:hypothetical protein
LYETELLEQFEDSDAAKEFFSCLDLQLNKVNQFFKTKEKEFLDRGDCLRKQMEILVELKSAFKKQRDKAANSSQDSSEDASINCTISYGTNDTFQLNLACDSSIPKLTSLNQRYNIRCHIFLSSSKSAYALTIRTHIHGFCSHDSEHESSCTALIPFMLNVSSRMLFETWAIKEL